MYRILYVNGGPMNRGGIESFMLNYMRHFDKERIHIDFAVRGPEIGELDNDIIDMGCKIYRLPMRSRHPFQYEKRLKDILKNNRYDAIHSHVDAMNFWILSIAKKCNIPVRISHSHNTQHLTTNFVKYLINEYARLNVNKVVTHRLACSNEAGKWLYGNKTFQIVHNAIEYSKFRFDPNERKIIRNQYGIDENTILIGNIGRFDTQKNHKFLIEIMSEIVKRDKRYKLMLIGDGWLRKEIENEIEKNNLKGNIILTGIQENTASFYNAFDIFAFPSLFEGLSFVLIEAQANGLTCVCSTGVPRESDITKINSVFFIPLEKEKWIDTLFGLGVPQRYISENAIKEEGYSIIEESKKLENYYIRIIDDTRHR